MVSSDSQFLTTVVTATFNSVINRVVETYHVNNYAGSSNFLLLLIGTKHFVQFLCHPIIFWGCFLQSELQLSNLLIDFFVTASLLLHV